MQEDAVQIRDVEPETSALRATEEDAVLSVGELGHLRVVARAIHWVSCSGEGCDSKPSPALFPRATAVYAEAPLTRRMVAPERRQLLLERLVAAVEVVDAVHDGGLALGAQAGQHQRGADARRSVAITGAPESRSTPRTTAVCPSMSMSAPMRGSSGTCMKRFSKIVLGDHATCPSPRVRQRHELRLHVGGEARDAAR